MKYDNLIILIPVRMASERLYGKPIVDINGKPKIQRIYEHVTRENLAPTYIVAGDQEIVDVVSTFTNNVLLTDPDLPSGTDRIMAGLNQIDPSSKNYKYVMNFQGDAINTNPSVISDLMDLSLKTGADITTVALPISKDKLNDPTNVKIAMGLKPNQTHARALYFSRNLIPHDRNNIIGECYHHVGLYLYTTESLRKFVSCEPGILEQREKLEQLRALENGMTIYVKLIENLKLYKNAPPDIDTPEDLEIIRKLNVWD